MTRDRVHPLNHLFSSNTVWYNGVIAAVVVTEETLSTPRDTPAVRLRTASSTSVLNMDRPCRPLLVWDHSVGDLGRVEAGSYRGCCSIQSTYSGLNDSRLGVPVSVCNNTNLKLTGLLCGSLGC
ncbi:hypothetical protein DPMN_041882 [Dreissena polymorpha]|uniref:Uncharacterized protein n=1 Tax=Dreissena polymorpha TaxID=45954 RepID=A0A9D4D0Z6_DREPO|nr:hypothetical protein DPMN_041882 [Dreissena polymorpha]